MKLTKEQKATLIADLMLPWGRVELLCDGDRITLAVQQAKPLVFRVVTFVNGEWRGEWCFGTKEFPEQKFLNKRTHRVYRPAYVKKMEKIFGKREVAKNPEYQRTFVTYDISWPNGRAAINHLCRVCESIEVAPAKEVTP